MSSSLDYLDQLTQQRLSTVTLGYGARQIPFGFDPNRFQVLIRRLFCLMRKPDKTETMLQRAFFTFRQDFWDGMDYEIGTKPPGGAYWQSIERGETPQPRREDNALWNVLKRELKE